MDSSDYIVARRYGLARHAHREAKKAFDDHKNQMKQRAILKRNPPPLPKRRPVGSPPSTIMPVEKETYKGTYSNTWGYALPEIPGAPRPKIPPKWIPAQPSPELKLDSSGYFDELEKRRHENLRRRFVRTYQEYRDARAAYFQRRDVQAAREQIDAELRHAANLQLLGLDDEEQEHQSSAKAWILEWVRRASINHQHDPSQDNLADLLVALGEAQNLTLDQGAVCDYANKVLGEVNAKMYSPDPRALERLDKSVEEFARDLQRAMRASRSGRP
jgi:hypothetical protein